MPFWICGTRCARGADRQTASVTNGLDEGYERGPLNHLQALQKEFFEELSTTSGKKIRLIRFRECKAGHEVRDVLDHVESAEAGQGSIPRSMPGSNFPAFDAFWLAARQFINSRHQGNERTRGEGGGNSAEAGLA